MNIYGIRAIYNFEMARTFRTLLESIAAPVLTTSLYFDDSLSPAHCGYVQSIWLHYRPVGG